MVRSATVASLIMAICDFPGIELTMPVFLREYDDGDMDEYELDWLEVVEMVEYRRPKDSVIPRYARKRDTYMYENGVVVREFKALLL